MTNVVRLFIKPRFKGQLRHMQLGKECGVPLCCRLNFIADSYLGIASGVARAVVGCKYVPCWIHYFRMRYRRREWKVGVFGVSRG